MFLRHVFSLFCLPSTPLDLKRKYEKKRKKKKQYMFNYCLCAVTVNWFYCATRPPPPPHTPFRLLLRGASEYLSGEGELIAGCYRFVTGSLSFSLSLSIRLRVTAAHSELTALGRHEACCPPLGLTALNLSLGVYFETVHHRDRETETETPAVFFFFFFFSKPLSSLTRSLALPSAPLLSSFFFFFFF